MIRNERKPRQSPAVTLFSEILTNEQLIRNWLSRVLPKGMEISHFSVLNHLAHVGEERSPAQLAKSFHVTRGAMTNTLQKLEWAGYVHIRPDWDDARRKMVTISPAGRQARDAAIAAITPVISELVDELGEARVRAALPVLRELRTKLEPNG
ncbi:MAG: MarR family transcriptional regulator [Roseovarius sp.]|nr:MarR family transcriptional regulator [Roseovarius sp.]